MTWSSPSRADALIVSVSPFSTPVVGQAPALDAGLVSRLVPFSVRGAGTPRGLGAGLVSRLVPFSVQRGAGTPRGLGAGLVSRLVPFSVQRGVLVAKAVPFCVQTQQERLAAPGKLIVYRRATAQRDAGPPLSGGRTAIAARIRGDPG